MKEAPIVNFPSQKQPELTQSFVAADVINFYQEHLYFFSYPFINKEEVIYFADDIYLQSLLEELSQQFFLTMLQIANAGRPFAVPAHVYTIDRLMSQEFLQVKEAYCQAILGCTHFSAEYFKPGGLFIQDTTAFSKFAHHPLFFEFIKNNIANLELLALHWEKEESQFNQQQNLNPTDIAYIKNRLQYFENVSERQIVIEKTINMIQKDIENLDKTIPRNLYIICVNNIVKSYLLHAKIHCLIKQEIGHQYGLHFSPEKYEQVVRLISPFLGKQINAIQASMFGHAYQKEYLLAVVTGISDFFKSAKAREVQCLANENISITRASIFQRMKKMIHTEGHVPPNKHVGYRNA